jgi:predicted TIM-barrel fold metal-dependent hydrolase
MGSVFRLKSEETMPIIDVQVHPYERDHPGRPWAGSAHGLASATGEEMVAAMDKVGVDAAVMVSSFNLYQCDPSYALSVYATYPERFRVVTPVDPTDPGIDDVVANWAATKGAVGIRIILRDGTPLDPADPGLTRTLAAAARNNLPVNFLCWGRLDLGTEIVRRNPDTVMVIDHLGLLQPAKPPVPANPWAELPKLLALAACRNVRVKISGACTLSREPFPYNDIWDPVLKIIDAFGLDRCMWGTDWTRTIGMLTYEQAVAPFRDTDRLSDSDKAQLMGGTLMNVYRW